MTHNRLNGSPSSKLLSLLFFWVLGISFLRSTKNTDNSAIYYCSFMALLDEKYDRIVENLVSD